MIDVPDFTVDELIVSAILQTLQASYGYFPAAPSPSSVPRSMHFTEDILDAIERVAKSASGLLKFRESIDTSNSSRCFTVESDFGLLVLSAGFYEPAVRDGR